MSILIKKTILDGKLKDIYIEENRIAEISESIQTEADHKLDGKGKAAMPSFANCHTHAAMNILRGYADDMQLDRWLNEKIWPLEAKMSREDVYAGSRLACLEMIKTGTTFFNDMYWHWHGTAKAASEMGLRAAISPVFIDFSDDMRKEHIAANKKLFQESKKYPKRISFALGPHALYTVSEESLLWHKEFAEKNNLRIHFHLSETGKEVDDCVKKHGMRPVEYLDKIGFLSPNLIACHSIFLSDREIGLLKKHDVKVVHNPVSNMKLASGGTECATFPYERLRKAGICMALGTDGSASNNNLDMFEEMKVAAILQKFRTNNPQVKPAHEVFQMATAGGAKAFGLDMGVIREGNLADLILLDMKHYSLVPNHNLVSNMVYSANGSVVDTTICDGKILMRGRKVAGEEEILCQVQEAAEALAAKI